MFNDVRVRCRQSSHTLRGRSLTNIARTENESCSISMFPLTKSPFFLFNKEIGSKVLNICLRKRVDESKKLKMALSEKLIYQTDPCKC